MSITIDSTTYNVPLKVINRKADALYKYAERTENGALKSEIIGVFFNYEVECAMSTANVNDYAALWVKLTEPVENHTVTMPDESGDLTFQCYFANITDEVVKWNESGTNYFRNLKFSVIATSPARTP